MLEDGVKVPDRVRELPPASAAPTTGPLTVPPPVRARAAPARTVTDPELSNLLSMLVVPSATKAPWLSNDPAVPFRAVAPRAVNVPDGRFTIRPAAAMYTGPRT